MNIIIGLIAVLMMLVPLIDTKKYRLYASAALCGMVVFIYGATDLVDILRGVLCK